MSRILPACLLATALSAGAWATEPDFARGMEAYRRGDFVAALQEWRPLAERGMVEAQFNLGLILLNGKGLETDAAAAHGWFLKAAEGGYARARYRVAEMYETGEGVRRDRVQAHLWFRMAAEQKYEDAKKRRKRLAKEMTPEQIAMAEMLARHRRRDARRTDGD